MNEGTKVRTTTDAPSGMHPGVTVPAGTEGVIIEVLMSSRLGYLVEFDLAPEGIDTVTVGPEDLEAVD